MTIIQAIILGLVEGVTEFLPISSTAHLIVVQRLMGITQTSAFFDVVVQLGALLAVIVYFWRTLIKLAQESLKYLTDVSQGKVKPAADNLPQGLSVLVASLPVFVVGFVLRHKVEALHDSFTLIAATSIVVAFILLIAQKRAAKTEKPVTAKNLIVMGLYQVLALLPGTSRSGIVISGGLLEGLSFKQAIEYSFLMSIPSLGVAGVYELYSAIKTHPSSEIVTATGVATLVAFLSALVVVATLLKLVRRLGFTPFVIYRILFGLFALWFGFNFHN